MLQTHDRAPPVVARVYCEHPAVNAAVSHYAGLAEQAGIQTDIVLDIPNALAVDALELSMVVSNLMENALHASAQVPAGRVPYLRFTCHRAGRLLLEMENACSADATLDEAGQPRVHANGHGIGSKSVAAFAKKYDAELLYRIENGAFRVRLLV